MAAAKKTTTKKKSTTAKAASKKTSRKKVASKKAPVQTPYITDDTTSTGYTPSYEGSVAGPYSFTSFIDHINANFAVYLIVGLGFIGGFFVGSLWTENRTLRVSGGSPSAQVAGAADPAAAAPVGPTAETLSNVPQVTDDDYVRGSDNAKITLIEYSDFECPFCSSFHPTMQAVQEKYSADVRWVYRHYPLSFHPNAQPLAEASECVAKFGGEDAFWAYGDMLFEKQGEITAANAAEYAAEVGVSSADVQGCMDSGEMTAKVTEIMDAGSAAGISGTPGTILVTEDGDYELISGALPQAQVEQVIEKYL